MAHDDEELVSCRICFINFDEKERLPKYLEKCYHFFCLPCIKVMHSSKYSFTTSLFLFFICFFQDLSGTVGRKKVACPVCRSISTLSAKKCEELVTNHVALRLLKVVEAFQAATCEKE